MSRCYYIQFPDMGIAYFISYDRADELWNLYDEAGGAWLGSSETEHGIRAMAADLCEDLMA